MLSHTARTLFGPSRFTLIASRSISLKSGPSQDSSDKQKKNKTTGGSFQPVDLAYKSFEVKNKPNKSPLVIHHSLLGRKKNWKVVAKEIHHLTKRTVVSVDARNHGDSPHSPEMSYSLMANDVKHTLKHLKMDKVSFMGHTMGGRIGMILALTQPQLIDQLVCVDTTPTNAQVSLTRWDTLRKACAKLKGMEKELRDCKGIGRSMMADKAIQSIMPDSRDRSFFLMNLFVKPLSSQDSDEDHSRMWRINMDAFLANPNLTTSFPEFPDDIHFDGRVLFVAGERSKFTSPKDEDKIRRLFPNVKFVWIKEGGHWIHMDKHEEFMSAVVPFIEGK